MMKKAIVLGGTYPHRELIRKLKEKGFYTILVDYYDSPIAKELADKHIKESTLDKEKVLEIAKKEKASLVISSCIDQANVTACYVGEKLGLPHPYSYATSLNSTDKVAMKRIMMANGIPTSKHIVIRSTEEFDDSALTYPLIVKPADSNSSKGVRRFEKDDPEKLVYIDKALKLSRSGKAVIEEFKTGREIGVDCIIKNHKAYVVMTRERRKIQSHNDAIQQIYGSFWPASITDKQLESLRLIAEEIGKSFDINNSPIMMQTIVGERDIDVIEFGARIGGGENYRIIKELTGYDIIEQSIRSFLNKELDLTFHKPTEFMADNYIYANACTFGKMVIDNSAKEQILYSNVYRKEGALVGADISSNNRVGVFVVKSNTQEGLIPKIMNVVNHMDVYDIDGNSVMRKDIY